MTVLITREMKAFRQIIGSSAIAGVNGSYRAKANFDSVFSFSECIFIFFHVFSLNLMVVIIVGP